MVALAANIADANTAALALTMADVFAEQISRAANGADLVLQTHQQQLRLKTSIVQIVHATTT